MNIINILKNYDLFIFDLDGTIIDSEKHHYTAYKQSLTEFNVNCPLNWEIYQKYGHSIGTYRFKDYIQIHLNNLVTYQDIYNRKEKIYQEICEKGLLTFIPGFPDFLHQLFMNNKQISIVTNSSDSRACVVKNALPLLNKISSWFTKDSVKNKKPHCEMIVRSLNAHPNIPLDRVILFEDSYVGYQALSQFNFKKIM